MKPKFPQKLFALIVISLESFIRSRLLPGGSLYNFQITSFYNVPPDVEYRYSNAGYALLGYLVEKISGMPSINIAKNNNYEKLLISSG